MYNTNSAMKKNFVFSILLLLAVAGCAYLPATPIPIPTSSPTASLQYAEQLAGQFCPIIYLCGEDEVVENFEPEQIEIMLDAAFLRSAEDPSFSEKATLPNLLECSKSVYYLDLAGLGPTSHSPDEYKLTYDEIKGQYQPIIYTRVREGEDKGYTVVQYWIFYYFNDWRNCHEGDWELVQLCFPALSAQELLERGEQPIFAAYSQHQAGQKMSWSDMNDDGLVVGTHPIVYVARGSHANYFTPGQFWSGLDFDDTGLSSWKVMNPEQFDVVLLPEVKAESKELGWLEFKGRWGAYLGFSISVLDLRFWQDGPCGPPWGEGGQMNRRWEHPDEWANGLPEQPEPFWTSFFKLPGDWSNLAIFCLFSPADIHVYDSQGRHVGVDEKGEVEKQIPGAVYITPDGTLYKTIIIPNANVSQGYRLVANGTGSGIMEIKAQVPDTENKCKRYLEYTNVPVSATTSARVNIIPGITLPEMAAIRANHMRDRVTKLELDSDGDEVFELESIPGNFVEKKATPMGLLKANIDIEPDTLALSGAVGEKSVTAYIELPEGYNPEDIDISTVRLMGDIPAWEGPIDVVDHDQDGIYELMVRFDRQLIIDYLEGRGRVEGRVSLFLTGTVGGRSFRGVGSILAAGDAVRQIEDDQAGLK